MIIAIDFDDTYNKDPGTWDDVIQTLQLNDHKVIMATYRHAEFDYDPLFRHLYDDLNVDCYFTDGKAKRPFLLDRGVKVDVWIDDNPFSITQDSAWTHNSPELHAWREANIKKLDVA